jgi:hypothetical protein
MKVIFVENLTNIIPANFGSKSVIEEIINM